LNHQVAAKDDHRVRPRSDTSAKLLCVDGSALLERGYTHFKISDAAMNQRPLWLGRGLIELARRN